MADTTTTTFTIKQTLVLKVKTGGIPPRLLAELIEDKGNGLLTDNYGIYDLGTVTETVDEVVIS